MTDTGNLITLVTQAKTDNDDVVLRLREMLEMAERGQIVAVAVATVSHDRSTGTTFVSGNHYAALTGAAAMLLNRLVEYQP